MRPLTRVQCTVQQLCAALLILGPFARLSLRWMVAIGPQATPGSLWDIACLSLIFFGLLLLLDNICSALNHAFADEEPVQ